MKDTNIEMKRWIEMTRETDMILAIALVLILGGMFGGMFSFLLGEDTGVAAGAILSGIEVGIYYLYLKIEYSRRIKSRRVI